MFPPLLVVGRLVPIFLSFSIWLLVVSALLLGNWQLVLCCLAIGWLVMCWVGTWLSKLVGASLFRFGRRLCMLGSEKMKRHLRKEYRAL